MEVHVNRNGGSFGPYEEGEARSLYARGNIAATDLVWHDGMAEWQTAAQLFGEKAVPAVAPPIVPPQPIPMNQAPPVAGYAAPASSPLPPTQEVQAKQNRQSFTGRLYSFFP